MASPVPRVPRRAVVGATVLGPVLGTLALAGCGERSGRPAGPEGRRAETDPDVEVVLTVQLLLQAADRRLGELGREFAEVAAEVKPYRRLHRRHLEDLRIDVDGLIADAEDPFTRLNADDETSALRSAARIERVVLAGLREAADNVASGALALLLASMAAGLVQLPPLRGADA